MIEEDPVRLAVDHRADEAQFFDASREFVDGCRRVAHRQRSERLKAVGVCRDGRGQALVQLAAPRRRRLRIEVLYEVAERGEHLHIDARVVHHLQPAFAQVIQGRGTAPGAESEVDARGLDDVARQHVLLDGDDLHDALPARGTESTAASAGANPRTAASHAADQSVEPSPTCAMC